ncbi:MAG TPA: FG-GAP-like repeat-containing protein, partial [Pyrinomonadaceae bacterium]
MLKNRSICFFALILVLVTTLTAAAVQNVDIVDPTFNAQIQTTTFRSKIVSHLVTLPDGKTLASGNFNTYNGQPVGGLIRLNADASLDTTFNNDLLETGSVPTSITLQADGKILLQGSFTLTNGTTYINKIVRLNGDGTIDSSFNYPYGGNIFEVRIDAAGRILVSGFIPVPVNGGTVNKPVARLNENGTIDSSFDSQTNGVERFTTQNNKILYTRYDSGAQQYRLFRLNEDGTIDSGFAATPVGSFQILEMRAQTDNKILVLADNKIFRISENGGIDPDFQITTNFLPRQPRKILLQSDGRITIAYGVNSPFGTRVIRLLPNGTFDPSFTPYIYLNSDIQGHTLQPDGGVLIGDESTNASTNRFIRLMPDGTPDPSFNPGGSGFQNINPGKIRAISLLANEKILIGGDFDKVNNVDRTKIARLNADSTLDAAFQINTSGTGNYFSQIRDIYHFAIQSDGKIIVSGNFNYFVNGAEKSSLVRLNQDGSIDAGFNLSLYIGDWYVISALGQNKPFQTADGKILVGTTRTIITDTMSIPLRLTSGGSKDTAFNPTIFNTKNVVTIFDLTVQTDGKILIAGRHVTHSGNDSFLRGFIARLNSDGTVDQSFQFVELVDKDVFTLKLLPNGQILIVSRNNLQSNVWRLNSDGSYDNSFNTGIGANGRINAIAVLPNNKILVGGLFSTYNNQPRQNLALLNADGSLDATLANINREVLCITIDSQGRVLIGGHFTSISGGQSSNSSAQTSTLDTNSSVPTVRSYIARLIVSFETTGHTNFDYDGDGKADLSVFRPSAGSWYISQSSNNAFIAVQFGAAGDLIAPADFDGDGKTDISVFRPSDGGWYRLNSSNNTFSAFQFGSNGDLPVPGDFDGDGKADLTVYR